MHAVFDLAALPAELTGGLPAVEDRPPVTRLLLVGHGGRDLWSAVQAAKPRGSDPIDDYSVATVDRWFRASFPQHHYHLLYPGAGGVALQRLGRLAGWHHPSPLMVGINDRWGTWFAYRVALVTDAPLAPTARQDGDPPCERCADKPCIVACPADAMAAGSLALERCVEFRLRPQSPCATSCPARLGCPVGAAHRYEPAQIRHTYTISLQAIAQYAVRAENGRTR